MRLALAALRGSHGRFGGVMGWEYFNSLPGGEERPWEWAREMTRHLRDGVLDAEGVVAALRSGAVNGVAGAANGVDDAAKAAKADGGLDKDESDEIDADDPGGKHVQVPAQFDYYTDASDQDS